MKGEVRARAKVEGLVQGVFFRYSTEREAKALGVKGWVRSLPDGSVEVVAEGEREKVERLLRWCHQGPPGARVERVSVQWEEPQGEEDFIIRY